MEDILKRSTSQITTLEDCLHINIIQNKNDLRCYTEIVIEMSIF